MFNLILEIIILLLLAKFGIKIPEFTRKKPKENFERFREESKQPEEIDEDYVDIVKDKSESLKSEMKNPTGGLDKLVNMDWRYKGVD